MKKESNNARSAQESKGRKPTHVIWQVIGEKDNAMWNRVGAGWAHSDGKGVALKFSAYPLTGRVVVREVKEDAGRGQ
jgi:hypothetical protein